MQSNQDDGVCIPHLHGRYRSPGAVAASCLTREYRPVDYSQTIAFLCSLSSYASSCPLPSPAPCFPYFFPSAEASQLLYPASVPQFFPPLVAFLSFCLSIPFSRSRPLTGCGGHEPHAAVRDSGPRADPPRDPARVRVFPRRRRSAPRPHPAPAATVEYGRNCCRSFVFA